MKTFYGYFVDGEHCVGIENEGEEFRALPMRLDLASHSPDGFCWGYNGSGPTQLSLAILANVVDDNVALKYYQRYKEQVISKFDIKLPFTLTKKQVEEWLTLQLLKEKE